MARAEHSLTGAVIHFGARFIHVLCGTPSGCCRFEPSCSTYSAHVIEREGCARGGWLAVKRLLKCGPWSRGGYDPPPGWEESVRG